MRWILGIGILLVAFIVIGLVFFVVFDTRTALDRARESGVSSQEVIIGTTAIPLATVVPTVVQILVSTPTIEEIIFALPIPTVTPVPTATPVPTNPLSNARRGEYWIIEEIIFVFGKPELSETYFEMAQNVVDVLPSGAKIYILEREGLLLDWLHIAFEADAKLWDGWVHELTVKIAHRVDN